MNRVIEIHDSILDVISVRDGVAVLHFSSVYIHESVSKPGVDTGSGWVQEAQLRITGAALKKSFSELPVDLSDGYLKLNERVLQNAIPLPLKHEGTVELHLKSWNDEAVFITGSGAEFESLDDPKYLEDFVHSWAPSHACQWSLYVRGSKISLKWS